MTATSTIAGAAALAFFWVCVGFALGKWACRNAATQAESFDPHDAPTAVVRVEQLFVPDELRGDAIPFLEAPSISSAANMRRA